MKTTERRALLGICLRLAGGLTPSHSEALLLASWLSGKPALFGNLPPLILETRRGPRVDEAAWDALPAHLSSQLDHLPEGDDIGLERLWTIAKHLGLDQTEEAILCLLTLQQRRGAIANFMAMLQRDIGLSSEAVIAVCCNLDEPEVWSTLGPQSRLVSLGLVQTDTTLSVMRDDPYTLSGLLLALISPPQRDGEHVQLT